MEITVTDHRYVVAVNGRQTTDFTNPRNDIVTDAFGLALKVRGLASSEEPLSGYVGIQAHTGNVAFRNIRIMRI